MSSTQSFPVAGFPLLRSLAENWWLLLLRGIAAVALGVLALAWPGLTFLTLIFLWGFYALVDGVCSLGAAFFGQGGTMVPRWWLAVVGVVGILAGIVTFGMPGVTGLLFLYLIASWAIVTGVMQIVGALQLRKEIEGEWWLILSGALSVAVGVILFFEPGAGVLVVSWTIGFYAILAGATLIALAFRLKKHKLA